MLCVGDLARRLDAVCPPAWAAPWDNVGLLVGDPGVDVRCCLCALDADVHAVRQARALGAQLLVAHHPAPFRALRRLSPTEPAASAVWHAVREGVAIYAAHTNFDVHPAGVNAALASALGLQETVPLQVQGWETLYKLVVYVPASHEEVVRAALAAVGAGQLGRYSDCSFASHGEGRFRPLAGSHPFVGQEGVLQRQDEWRLEVLLPEHLRAAGLAALRSAHPYEEIAYDLIRLENPGPKRGLGLVGDRTSACCLGAFAAEVARRLQAPCTRFVGDPQRPVRRVAVCGGAGADLVDAALAAGADVLVTADVRYHEARAAEEAALGLVDPGHWATEAPAVPRLADLVRQAAAVAGEALQVVEAARTADVWRLPGGPEGPDRKPADAG